MRAVFLLLGFIKSRPLIMDVHIAHSGHAKTRSTSHLPHKPTRWLSVFDAVTARWLSSITPAPGKLGQQMYDDYAKLIDEKGPGSIQIYYGWYIGGLTA